MRSIDLAFEDIEIAVRSGIVHKYLLSNAPDMLAIARLARICHPSVFGKDLFPWVAAIAHVMVNPRVINELIKLVVQFSGEKNEILKVLLHDDTKAHWNTAEFHEEMKAVTSDYQQCGGYQLSNFNLGIAAQFFHSDFSEQFIKLVRIVSNWLYSSIVVREEDLIRAIFTLTVPGMHHEMDRENGYWLLHFCRWISFVRKTVFQLPIVESARYLDMIGVRAFRNHYDNLFLPDMQTLFLRCKEFVERFEVMHGRPLPSFTYGDFGCLTCETHRMLDELSNTLMCSEDRVREILRHRLKTALDVESWIGFKETCTNNNQGPSVVNSARYNASLFAQACRLAPDFLSAAKFLI